MREISKEKEAKIKKNMTILVIVVAVLGLLISIDLILVTKADIGPFLAIPIKTYDDGGTKEYYGLGYKVIRYHQEEGRRDTKVGFWWMPYSIEPTQISMLDLALAFRNYPEKSYKKYYNQYLQINGEIKKVSEKKKEITLYYQDEEGAYNLELTCLVLDKNVAWDSLKKKDNITLVGTLSEFNNIQKGKPMVATLKDCFVLK